MGHFTLPGQEGPKAQAAKRMLTGEISEECPCTALRRADHAALYLDPDSASLL